LLEEDRREETTTEQMAHWGLLLLPRTRAAEILLGVEFAMEGGNHILKENLLSIPKQLSVANGSSVRHGPSCLPCSSIFKTSYLFFGCLIHENTVFISYLLLKASSNSP
jgi:ABC-type cobalamin transport system permease subunit